MNADLAILTATLDKLEVFEPGNKKKDKAASRIRAGDFSIESRLVSSAAEALAAFTALDGSGWAWFAHTEGTVIVSSGWLAHPAAGPIESGERASADGLSSVAIHLEGAGHWRITHCRRIPAAPDSAALLMRRSFLRRGAKNSGSVWYEVLWRPDADGALCPVASRFTGFNPPTV